MSAANIQQMAAHVADLIEARLKVGGATLAEKLRRAGRRLPRNVRRNAAYLAETAQIAAVPKLMVQIDQARAAQAYDACLRHLKPLGAGARRKAIVMQVLTGVGAGIFGTAVLLLAVLVWRGYL
jgi:RIO-like serine/threonine protein kinase